MSISLSLFTFAMKCNEKGLRHLHFAFYPNILQSRDTSAVWAAFLRGTALAGTKLQMVWIVSQTPIIIILVIPTLCIITALHSFVSMFIVGPIGCRPYCGFSSSPSSSPCKPIINKEPHFGYLSTATHISYIAGMRTAPGFIGRWPRQWQRHTERQIQRQRRGQISQ